MIKSIVIDDEPVAREIINRYINDSPGIECIAEFSDAISALEFIKNEKIDLIFLDINMPKLSGIGFLKSLANPPQVILSTAYSEYAVDGFELDVLDYLLKPYSFDRFLKALQKYQTKNSIETIPLPYVSIKADGKVYRINLDDILYVESVGDYLTLHLIEKKLTFNQTLKNFVEMLSPSLIRVHKSYAVTIKNISFVEGNIISINNFEVPIGASFREDFFKSFSG